VSSQVTLPRLGQGMESGTIVRWLKAEGDTVEKGQVLYELDTEKATQEVEAEASGTLLKILAGEGEEIEVGTAIAVIGDPGEDVPDAEPGGPAEEHQEQAGAGAPRERAESEVASAPRPPAGEQRRNGGRVKASPLARRIARERGIDLRSLSGTGPEGRIVAEDVERAEKAAPAAAAAPPGEVEVVPLTGMRKAIARRMTEAWEAPVFQITITADMSAAVRLRAALVARMREGDAKPTYSDILTKVCAVALRRHPAVNALFAEDEIHLMPTANVGIAVAVPNGLVVPVQRSCETRTIPELANERADLVARTRDGRLRQEDLEGGTFTISNLGMYGVERFVAVLNPPQAAILAVGAIEERADVRDGARRGRCGLPFVEVQSAQGLPR
jgi:pyruvate dehydrogenase E2 component (dihydrolipoamide acetyltransferase)